MEFAKEMYPTFEEACEATVESNCVSEAVSEFLYVADRWESEEVRKEAAITMAQKILLKFEREKSRAKDCTDEDAHAEVESA